MLENHTVASSIALSLSTFLRCQSIWGYITPEIAGKFPGYLSPSAGLKFADVPNGLAAISKAYRAEMD